MRQLGSWLGFALVLIAAATLLAQGLNYLAGGSTTAVSLGSIWYGIHANSLVGFQALVEKGLGPALWVPLRQLLTWPAWLTLGVPGLLLVLTTRPRRGSFGGGF
jgi:hypothetical protein